MRAATALVGVAGVYLLLATCARPSDSPDAVAIACHLGDGARCEVAGVSGTDEDGLHRRLGAEHVAGDPARGLVAHLCTVRGATLVCAVDRSRGVVLCSDRVPGGAAPRGEP